MQSYLILALALFFIILECALIVGFIVFYKIPKKSTPVSCPDKDTNNDEDDDDNQARTTSRGW